MFGFANLLDGHAIRDFYMKEHVYNEKIKSFFEEEINIVELTRKKRNYLTTSEFIKKTKQIHGNRFNYIKTKYINMSTKIIIICNKHKIKTEYALNNNINLLRVSYIERKNLSEVLKNNIINK